MHCPVGVVNGNAVAEKAEHILSICCAVCQFWQRCLRNTNTVADLVLTGDQFDDAKRQVELKLCWENSEAGFTALTEQEVKHNFNLHYEDF